MNSPWIWIMLGTPHSKIAPMTRRPKNVVSHSSYEGEGDCLDFITNSFHLAHRHRKSFKYATPVAVHYPMSNYKLKLRNLFSSFFPCVSNLLYVLFALLLPALNYFANLSSHHHVILLICIEDKFVVWNRCTTEFIVFCWGFLLPKRFRERVVLCFCHCSSQCLLCFPKTDGFKGRTTFFSTCWCLIYILFV